MSAAKVVFRPFDSDCGLGLCVGLGCSHMMWSCTLCSCEGGWGCNQEQLEQMASKHICPAMSSRGEQVMSDYTPTTEEVRMSLCGGDTVRRTMFDRWLAEHDRQVKAAERRRIMRKVRSVLGDSGAFGFLGEFEGVLDSIEHEVSK